MNHLYSAVWLVAIVITIAMFWIRSPNKRSWAYVAMGIIGCTALAMQLIFLHNTVSVFISGGYIVMNVWFWIKMREQVERNKLEKDRLAQCSSSA